MNNDDWNIPSAPSSQDWPDSQPGTPVAPIKGGWHWALTLLCLLATCASSALFFFLTRDVTRWTVPLVALAFTVPTAAILFAALFMEYKASLMTPRLSRGAQALVALAVTCAVFAVGCLGQLGYVFFGYKPANYIFLIDKSSSMRDASDLTNQRKTAVQSLLDDLPDDTYVGLVLFNHEIVDELTLTQLNNDVRAEYGEVLSKTDNGMTNFYYPLRAALDMLENNEDALENPTRIVLLTDGDALLSARVNLTDLETITAEECNLYNASVSCLKIGGDIRSDLSELINDTNGVQLSVSTAGSLSQNLFTVRNALESDILQARNPKANWIAGILFILTGLFIGAGLCLMLSRRHQFRVQWFISPLMGGIAFVLCKYANIQPTIVCEIVSFSSYGFVFMRKNR